MDVKIYAHNLDPKAISQVYDLAKLPPFDGSVIRIMPDAHAGTGCVIGFTATTSGKKLIPNVIGVDIGCGMRCLCLGKIDIDFARLDTVIREHVPSGMAVHTEMKDVPEIEMLRCKDDLRDAVRLYASIGTLGGGNHFIEVDADDDGVKYLVIHTGSRNLGLQVAKHYQNIASGKSGQRSDIIAKRQETVERLKAEGRANEIQSALREIDRNDERRGVPSDQAWVSGQDAEDYLHDMSVCQDFAVRNRAEIARVICEHMGWSVKEEFESVHNYMDIQNGIIRKGAISARDGERVIIPLNMRDGCILGFGRGKDDWNTSAPHGAGRCMSRSEAKEIIDLDSFREAMEGIYTTCVNTGTIDESPFAYKDADEIIDIVGGEDGNVVIEKIVKPIYNYKAS